MKSTSEYAATRQQSGRLNVALWLAQVVLALLFLFAGVMKFIMPVEAAYRIRTGESGEDTLQAHPDPATTAA